jgi:hypothetical protein
MIPKPNGGCRLDIGLFKGYKLHVGTTTEGIILSHVFTTANRHDTAVDPEVFSALKGWNIPFAL